MSANLSNLYFNQRVLNNNLWGDVSGTLMMAQSTTLPARASEIEGDIQPHLVGLRDTLVLFKPIAPATPGSVQLEVDEFVVQMSPPGQLPPVTERSSDSEYGRIAYGDNFWSAIVPAQYWVRGARLTVTAGGKKGDYQAPDVGAPSDLLLNTIDIGMLTPYRPLFIDTFTAERQREFFQTTPCSRLIVNQYEPVNCPIIVLADGTRYTDHSAGEGGWLSGDLRQRIGKELISLGINNASLGIHSSPGSGENGLNKHLVTAQLTAHSSVGNYVNGRVIHGGSGGGGMVTLERCTGNEFSHEVGHNYGLNHYPGGFNGSVHRAAHSPNSAWGWDSDHNVFMPNFMKSRNGQDTCLDGVCEPPFHGHAFGRDTMGDGLPLFPQTNQYTQLTPFSMNVAQTFLEEKAIFSKSSATGYLKWNPTLSRMEEWGELYRPDTSEMSSTSLTWLLREYHRLELDLWDGHWLENLYMPQASSLDKGKSVRIIHQATFDTTLRVNGNTRVLKKGDVLNYEVDGTWVEVEDFSTNVAGKPEQVGVPVTTLVGFYDPTGERQGFIYPALHCAYGVTYKSSNQTEVDTARCHALIRGADGQEMRFILRRSRVNTSELNRFHFNVPQSMGAKSVFIITGGLINAELTIQPPQGTARVTITGGP
ncbi:M66 family metalloprotease [Pseudomonas wadenswilerensis]